MKCAAAHPLTACPDQVTHPFNISSEDFRVKVSKQNVRGIHTGIDQIGDAMTSVRVLPLPAPAITSEGPSAAVTAAYCCALSSLA